MKDKKEKKGFLLLLQWAGKDKKFIYCAAFLSLIVSLLTFVPYYVFYKIIDNVIHGTCTNDLALHFAIILIVVMGIKCLLHITAILSSHKGAYNTLFKVRCMVTNHMAKMPLGALNERSTGEIKYVMNESIEKLELFLAHNFPEFILYMTGPLVMFIYLMTVNWKLGLISIIPLILVGLVTKRMYKKFAKYLPEINTSSANLSGSINEYVNGMRLIKAYKIGSQSFKKYSEGISQQHNVWCKISHATGVLYSLFSVLIECGVIFLVPVSGYMFIHGHITASVLILFSFVGSRYLTDIKSLQELGNNLSFSMNAVKQVKSILDTPVFGKGVQFPVNHNIDVSNVGFEYEKDKKILSNCNISISHGERIAVIGESGAGKSTLVQLISRFYDVTEGKITIGGINIKDIDYDDLLANISVVFQQSFLTRGSIKENIAMGNSQATLDEIRQAAKKAQIDDFIMTLPDKYDTLVGGYGSRFSGGQKQRICIARAILKNSPVLILDEATSAADPENQVEIDKAIENLCIGKTVIIVAHRLGIVQSCDRVAVVENGTILHGGYWEDLLEESPYFSKAWSDYNTARNMKYSMKGVCVNE